MSAHQINLRNKRNKLKTFSTQYLLNRYKGGRTATGLMAFTEFYIFGHVILKIV